MRVNAQEAVWPFPIARAEAGGDDLLIRQVCRTCSVGARPMKDTRFRGKASFGESRSARLNLRLPSRKRARFFFVMALETAADMIAQLEYGRIGYPVVN